MKSREEFWAEHIAGWRESGLTARDYAATAGINPAQLRDRGLRTHAAAEVLIPAIRPHVLIARGPAMGKPWAPPR